MYTYFYYYKFTYIFTSYLYHIFRDVCIIYSIIYTQILHFVCKRIYIKTTVRLHNITQNNILHYSVSIHIIYLRCIYDSLGKYKL